MGMILHRKNAIREIYHLLKSVAISVGKLPIVNLSPFSSHLITCQKNKNGTWLEVNFKRYCVNTEWKSNLIIGLKSTKLFFSFFLVQKSFPATNRGRRVQPALWLAILESIPPTPRGTELWILGHQGLHHGRIQDIRLSQSQRHASLLTHLKTVEQQLLSNMIINCWIKIDKKHLKNYLQSLL